MTPSEIDTRLLAAIHAEVHGPLVAQDTLRAVKDALADLGLMIVPDLSKVCAQNGMTFGMVQFYAGDPGGWSAQFHRNRMVFSAKGGFDNNPHQPVAAALADSAPFNVAALSVAPFETGEVA